MWINGAEPPDVRRRTPEVKIRVVTDFRMPVRAPCAALPWGVWGETGVSVPAKQTSGILTRSLGTRVGRIDRLMSPIPGA
jgi:hypothetical protein